MTTSLATPSAAIRAAGCHPRRNAKNAVVCRGSRRFSIRSDAMKSFAIAVSLGSVVALIFHEQWRQQAIDSSASFRGVSVVSDNVAWISGTQGTYGHTGDG